VTRRPTAARRQPPVLCESPEVDSQVETWNRDPSSHALAEKYFQMMTRLEAGWPSAGKGFDKLRGKVYEFRVAKYRVIFGPASNGRIAVAKIVHKQSARLPPKVLDQLEKEVNAHIKAIEEAGDSGCP
jgi:hypothetical protein